MDWFIGVRINEILTVCNRERIVFGYIVMITIIFIIHPRGFPSTVVCLPEPGLYI